MIDKAHVLVVHVQCINSGQLNLLFSAGRSSSLQAIGWRLLIATPGFNFQSRDPRLRNL